MAEEKRLIIALIASIALTTGIEAFPKEETNTFEYGLGCILEEINATSNITLNIVTPPTWDWRDYGIMTSVKSQGACGSCVAFACVGAFEALIKWKTGAEVDLSEAHLFFCGGGDCDYGWYVSAALNFMESVGVCDEDCFPYDGAYYGNDLPCSPCDDWRERAYKIEDWGAVTGIKSIKEALITYGPLIVTFIVYSDFITYWNNPYAWENAVYRHESGTRLGGHAVVLVGYDDRQQCWICKNSWGLGCLNGYFKIGYGECGIDDGAYYMVVSSPFIADADGPYKAKLGEEIQFNGSAYGGNPPYEWEWDFGDGSYAYEQNPIHVYNKSGIYAVKLIVRDASGQQAVATTQAIINNPPYKPYLEGPTAGKIYTMLNFTAKAVDADGDLVRYIFDWGDGGKTTTDFVVSGTAVIAQHAWKNYGIYEVKVVAEDDKGDRSKEASLTVKIGRSNPPLPPYEPYPPDNATGIDFNITLSWNCSDPDGDTLYYTIFFGEKENMSIVAENISSNRYEIHNLKPYTTYYWQVLARDEYGMESYSKIWKFTTKDIEKPLVKILYPSQNCINFYNFSIPWINTVAFEEIYVDVYAMDNQSGIDRVEFYVNGELRGIDYSPPYFWLWKEEAIYGKYLLEVIAYDKDGNIAKDEMIVKMINALP